MFAETVARHDAPKTLNSSHKTTPCPSDMGEQNPVKDKTSPFASSRTESTEPTLSRDQETPTAAGRQVVIEIPSDDSTSESDDKSERLETQPPVAIEILSSDEESQNNPGLADSTEKRPNEINTVTRKRPSSESNLENGHVLTKRSRPAPRTGNQSNSSQHANVAATDDSCAIDGANETEAGNAPEEISPKTFVLDSGILLSKEKSERNLPPEQLDCPAENAEALKTTVGQNETPPVVKESERSMLDSSNDERSNAKHVSDTKVASLNNITATGTEHSSSDMEAVQSALNNDGALAGSTVAPNDDDDDHVLHCDGDQDLCNGHNEYEAIIAPDPQFGIGLNLSASHTRTIVAGFKKHPG